MQILPQNDFEYYLTLDGERTKLVFAPVGWDSDTIGEFKRDTYYRGLIRTLSLPMNFTLDGYDICRMAWDKYGYEAQVIFECKKLQRGTFTYETIFLSELDFSQYDDNGTQISVILLEGGISKDIKSKESTKFEYPLTGTDVVNMVIPGVAFNEKADFIFLNEGQSDRFMPAIDLVNNDTNSGFVTVQNVQQEENITNESATFATSGNWFVRNNRSETIPISVKGFIKGGAAKTIGSGNDFVIVIRDQNNVTVRTIYTSPSFNPGQSIEFDVPFDFTHNLTAGQRLFWFIRTDTIPSNLQVIVAEGDLSIGYTQVSDPSNCKGIRAYDLFKRIIKRINPSVKAESALLDDIWNGLIITSGTAIREQSDAVIQITLRDFFKAVNSWEDAALGMDSGVVRLELATYFYRRIEIANIGNVKECNFTVATDLIYNNCQIGYNDGSTDDTDGQFEVNSKQEWQLPVTRIQNTADWISPIRADQYGIEKLRVNYVKKTDDTSSDNDTFAIRCWYTGPSYEPLMGSSYASVTGMATYEAGQKSYNLSMTPKNSLLRKQGYLKSMLDKLEGRYIEFASAEKNANLVTVSVGVNAKRVAERESVQVANLEGKYFRPVVATISVKLARNMMQLMDSKPFGYITFNFDGLQYSGYMLECGVDLAKNTEREFKLLLTDAVVVEVPPEQWPVPINIWQDNKIWLDTKIWKD